MCQLLYCTQWKYASFGPHFSVHFSPKEPSLVQLSPSLYLCLYEKYLPSLDRKCYLWLMSPGWLNHRKNYWLITNNISCKIFSFSWSKLRAFVTIRGLFCVWYMRSPTYPVAFKYPIKSFQRFTKLGVLRTPHPWVKKVKIMKNTN